MMEVTLFGSKSLFSMILSRPFLNSTQMLRFSPQLCSCTGKPYWSWKRELILNMFFWGVFWWFCPFYAVSVSEIPRHLMDGICCGVSRISVFQSVVARKEQLLYSVFVHSVPYVLESMSIFAIFCINSSC